MAHKLKPQTPGYADETTPPDIQLLDITRDGVTIRPARLEKGEWIDPDDSNPNRREAKRVTGYRVRNTVTNLHARSPREITAEHVRAANRLERDYELSEGARANTGSYDRVDGSTGGGGPTIAQIDALGRFRRARTALGPLAQYVLPVVLSGWTVERLAEACALSCHRVHGRLASGLDMLAHHYWPDAEVATIVPAAILDPLVSDIPQERLGRGRR